MLLKKLLVSAIVVGFLSGAVNAAGISGVSLAYAGVGFQVGLVIPRYIDIHDVDRNAPGWADDEVNVGLHLAAQGDIGFALGQIGEIHYWPSAGIWFGGNGDHDYHVFAMEIELNLFDLYYQPPVPIAVKPYAGMGPMVNIMIGKWEYNGPGAPYHDGGTDAAAGFNLFAGAHFDISSNFRLFAEMRGKLSRWDLFRLTGGMTFGVGR